MGEISADLKAALEAGTLAVQEAAAAIADLLAAAAVIEPTPPPPDPEPPGLAPGTWEIDGATVRCGPYLPGQTRWKIGARNLGATGSATYYLTLAADTFEHTFPGPPSSITAKDFELTMGRVGYDPEWVPDDWRPISAQAGPTPAPTPDPPDPTPAPPPSSGGTVTFDRPGPFRVMYRKDSKGGSGNVLGGVLGFPSLATPTTSGRFEYLFTPDADFEWSVGGMKLPGPAGGTAPTGGNHNPNGWTARLQLERTSSMPSNEAFYTLYLYCISPASNTGGYGTIVSSGGTRVYARAGKQDRVQIDITRGTPGQANGTATLTVNGVIAARHTAVNWASASAPISKVQGESFFGGTNVCPKDQSATFSGFRFIDLA